MSPALDGFQKVGWPQPGERVLVAGAMGKVGLAAAAVARLHGAQVVGIKRAGSAAVPGHAFDQLFDQNDPELTAKLMALTGQKGFPLVFNTVGSPYLAFSLDVLAQRGRQVLISTLERDCPFDIFKFFRKELSFHGVDTLKKDTVASNELLARLVPHIASGRLTLPQEGLPRIYSLEAAGEGFRQTFLHGGIGLLQPSAA